MERLKWMLHKLLLKALNNSTQSVSIHGQINEDLSPTLYQWVFCSTIGELNACKSLITKIEEQGQLVLLTDRACYIETYQQAFPSAVVVCLYGHYSEAKQLIKKFHLKTFISVKFLAYLMTLLVDSHINCYAQQSKAELNCMP